MKHSCVICIVMLAGLVIVSGCGTTGGSMDGPIVVTGEGSAQPGMPDSKRNEAPGKTVAAGNHIENAYRFLVKDKPAKARKELEKAGRKGVKGFWLHYYMGGALYFLDEHEAAIRSWEAAYDAAADASKKSRIRTCQSYAQYGMANEALTRQLLTAAADIDPKNFQAGVLLEELEQSRKSADSGRVKGNKARKGMKKVKDREIETQCVEVAALESRSQFRAYFLIEMKGR
jgi:hypothetical protein